MQFSKAFRMLQKLSVEDVPASVADFLVQLGGPAVIKLDGRDNRRCRFVVTLLHGNEPSGLKAIHQLLREGFEPEVDTYLAIVSVEAALTEPQFSHRYLPDQRDMNRLFAPPYTDAQAMLAAELLDIIRRVGPEAVIDLHNTSGDGPAFAVAVEEQPIHMDIAILFTHRLIITDIRLGALMESRDFNCPVVTIECGGAAQALSDTIARQGLKRFMTEAELARPMLPDSEKLAERDIYRHPVRVELKPAGCLCYAEEPCPDMDITLPLHLDRRNFGIVGPDSPLAWLNCQGINNLRVVDASGHDVIDQYFVSREGKLYPRTFLKLFMVTTNPSIAVSDCIFYAVKEVDHTHLQTTRMTLDSIDSGARDYSDRK
ncbi:succinylglutamate desuccinylase/aspartoacylase domain-containing protein [Porticoccus hydrocarbonoclasticus]|uniref:succinylglutamate desuccinylase/aspartoacylase domain-containing protein n=1 Tax=Porticoccus hydrocarbonoclasticus TaxID=1073414 RepID=UPI002354F1C5|nr:succinylglutamate desuccinylase/aspartoacylase family protein [Porticoccus hydrocarbonoclasticus]